MEVSIKSIERVVSESKFREQVVCIPVGILRVSIVIYTINIAPCIKIRYLLILEIALNKLSVEWCSIDLGVACSERDWLYSVMTGL